MGVGLRVLGRRRCDTLDLHIPRISRRKCSKGTYLSKGKGREKGDGREIPPALGFECFTGCN